MRRPLVIDLSESLALLFLWTLAQGLFLLLEPTVAAGQVLLVGLLFTARYVAPGAAPLQAERRARSRVRPLGAQWPWAVIAAIAVAVLLLVFLSVYTRLVPMPTDVSDPVDEYLKRPLGWVPLLIAAVAVGPLIEEVIFRGWIQGRLTRQFGPEIAIAFAAALFAAAHFDPWGMPHRLLLGLASGYTVYLTRSVWAGVMMHATFNGALFVADYFYEFPGQFSALSAGAEGTARAAGIALAAAGLAVLAWRRMRVIHDRLADAPEASEDAAEPGAD
jgi:membrane protease YdiL (CAAX protease family)